MVSGKLGEECVHGALAQGGVLGRVLKLGIARELKIAQRLLLGLRGHLRDIDLRTPGCFGGLVRGLLGVGLALGLKGKTANGSDGGYDWDRWNS